MKRKKQGTKKGGGEDRCCEWFTHAPYTGLSVVSPPPSSWRRSLPNTMPCAARMRDTNCESKGGKWPSSAGVPPTVG